VEGSAVRPSATPNSPWIPYSAISPWSFNLEN
jgi:hypothetical protein